MRMTSLWSVCLSVCLLIGNAAHACAPESIEWPQEGQDLESWLVDEELTSTSTQIAWYVMDPNGVATLISVGGSTAGIIGPSVEQFDASFAGSSFANLGENTLETCDPGSGLPTKVFPTITTTARRPAPRTPILFIRIPDRVVGGVRYPGRNVKVDIRIQNNQITCQSPTEDFLRAQQALLLAFPDPARRVRSAGAVIELRMGGNHTEVYQVITPVGPHMRVCSSTCPGGVGAGTCN
jgi:hypothetical protein